MLDKLIDAYVCQEQKKLGLDGADAQDAEDVKRLKKHMYALVSDEVRAREGEDYFQEMRQRVDQEEKRRRQAWRRKNLAEVVIDAIFLAVLIGLTVNQATNLMEQIRQRLGWSPVTTPVMLILLLAIVIFLFAIVKLGLLQRKGDGLA